MDDGSWSTAQVARMSKVTSRTLRHYDDIGLLRPAHVADGGMRYYRRQELVRLQQILVLRDLGLPLEAIATIVNGGGDEVEQLRRHHRWLSQERDRFARLADTVSATIEKLKGRELMRPEELFENFDPAKQERYEAELVQRYGDEVAPHIEQSKQRMGSWSRVDAARIQDEWARIGPTLAGLIDEGRAVDDPTVQKTIAGHYRWICNFWTPNRESYPGLGQLYVDSPEFRAQFDAVDARLAEYLRDAMTVYAQTHL
jgi:MerR family transcriptional regulator, thiopeptide resistance regulator